MRLIIDDKLENSKYMICALLRARNIFDTSLTNDENSKIQHYAYDGNHKIKVGVFLGDFIMRFTTCEKKLDAQKWYLVVSYEKSLEKDKDFVSKISNQLADGFYKTNSKFTYQDIYGIKSSNMLSITYRTNEVDIVKATNKKKQSIWNFLIFPVTF